MKSRVIGLSIFLCIVASIFLCSANSIGEKINYDGWNLVWEENFNNHSLDSTVWGYMQRRGDQSRKYHSSFPGCYGFNDSCIILKGIRNPDLKTDTAPYLTGAITTKDKFAFKPPCRIEVRAKINSAQGAWPAFWLMPFKKEKGWPMDGEIDIMEHLNYDDFVYQTVHSSYTKANGSAKPQRFVKANFNKNGFNTFTVDILNDKVEYYVNGMTTLSYPKIDSLQSKGQFPFFRDWYLMLDMQLGGNWVGKINPDDIPVDMEIDWVKYYRKNK